MTEGPDRELLQALSRLGKGRHKIYLGWAPGVGKTHRALLEVRELKERGVDVVIGWLEAKDRPLLKSLVSGLEALPPAQVEVGGRKMEVMDLEALLARRPTTVLVDELARQNPPGYPTRLEEVERLLEAGISVISTLNAMHLSSLAEAAGRYLIRPVEVRIPDRVLAEAEELVVVDLPPEALLERLEQIPYYRDMRASPLFRLSTLKALRELTLHRVAELYATPTTFERILVLVPQDTAWFRRLVDYGAERSRRLGGELYVVHLEPILWWGKRIALEETARAYMERYTQEHGGHFLVRRAASLGLMARKLVEELKIQVIVLGQSGPKALWRRSLVRYLLHTLRDWEIHLVSSHTPKPVRRRPAPAKRPMQSKQGRLKVFLGAAAGVGKTYAMLQEAQELRKKGVDVVIGIVETHGRKETAAQAEGLEVIPRRKVIYRGLTLEEMDLEALLQRHPELALVDELAHSNVPGSKNAKRYQDVVDLLSAGIDVYTTVNVQHLETLNDVIARITGIRVRETVPDWVLTEADQVELIDVPPEVLRERLALGKIYPEERIEQALQGFFTRENLMALRDLALQMAERGESPPEGAGGLLVAVAAREADAALIRRGARVALRLGLSLYVLHAGPSNPVVEKLAQLTHSLEGTFLLVEGPDWVEEIRYRGPELRIEQLVIGQSSKGHRVSTAERIAFNFRDLNLMVIPVTEEAHEEGKGLTATNFRS